MDVVSPEHQQKRKAEATLTGPDPAYGLSLETIEQASLPSKIVSALRSLVASDIMGCQEELRDAQASLRALIKDEHEAKRLDQQKANARRYDYGPLALKLAQVLARKPIAEYNKINSKRKKQKR